MERTQLLYRDDVLCIMVVMYTQELTMQHVGKSEEDAQVQESFTDDRNDILERNIDRGF